MGWWWRKKRCEKKEERGARGDETKRKRGRKGKKSEGGRGSSRNYKEDGRGGKGGEMILFLLFRKVFLLFPWKGGGEVATFWRGERGLFIHQGEAGPMPTR